MQEKQRCMGSLMSAVLVPIGSDVRAGAHVDWRTHRHAGASVNALAPARLPVVPEDPQRTVELRHLMSDGLVVNAKRVAHALTEHRDRAVARAPDDHHCE
jgi:hypothetical protein